jgi:hypothetical protein
MLPTLLAKEISRLLPLPAHQAVQAEQDATKFLELVRGAGHIELNATIGYLVATAWPKEGNAPRKKAAK